MRYILILNILVLFLHANDIDRIEKIVNEIESLRESYNICQDKLSSQSMTNNSSSKLKSLEINTADLTVKLQEKSNEIEVLKQELISEHEKLKVEKESNEKLEIKLSKVKLKKPLVCKPKVVTKIVKEKIYKPKIITKTVVKLEKVDDNHFPSLEYKDKYKIKKSKTKAKTYKLKNDSDIVFNKTKKVKYIWEKNTSFTSSHKEGNYIQITGYFIDSKWKSSKDENIWIMSSKAVLKK